VDGGGTHNEIHGGVFFGAVVQGRHVTVQLPAQVTPALSGLPARAAGFTGRDEALASVLAGLDPAVPASGFGAAVCSVAGLAGVGKTELAVQAAHAALGRGWFPGGVLFVDLHGYDEARRVEPAAALDGLLRALGMPAEHIPPESQDRARLYASILAEFAQQDRRVLVVVDNAFSAEQARPLLPTDGATGALVTSRHTLAGMDARLLDLGVLALDDAVDLLERVVRSGRDGQDPRFRVERAAAEQIAGWCGCLPLALRIVAALLAEDPNRPLAAVAADLAQERTRLDELRYEERAVRAAFELSYRQLDREQARIFRLLPVNPGPDLATEAATVLSDAEERDVRHALEALARAHLVERGVVYGRWRMHDLVRVYAGELAAAEDGGAREAALDRLLEYYRATADAADSQVRGLPPGERTAERFRDNADAFAWFDRERANLVAAGMLAASLGRGPTAILIASSATGYLMLRRRFHDAVILGEAAVRAARQADGRRSEAAALDDLGSALVELRRFDEAIAAHRQAVAIHRETDDRHGEAAALDHLGSALAGLRRFDEAITAHRQALTIHQQSADPHGEALALNNVGLMLYEMRRFDEAITAYEQAVAIHQDLDNQHGMAGFLTNLGSALAGLQRFDEAITAHRQAVTIYEDLGDEQYEAGALCNLGATLAQAGRFEEAVTPIRQAAAVYQEIDAKHDEARALNNLGACLRGVDRYEEAMAPLRQAVAIYQQTGDRYLEAGSQNLLGANLRDLNRPDEAIAPLQQALEIYEQTGDQPGEAGALLNLGCALAESGRFEDADAPLRRAADVYQQIGEQRNEGTALNSLGLSLGKLRRFDEAAVAHKQAADIFSQLGDLDNQVDASVSLGAARLRATIARFSPRRRGRPRQ
jgi:tetratricopeptide (TPR) repeat protein